MLIDETARTIKFRQSWIDTFQKCCERGRLAIVKPEFDEAEGDAALCGTAAHAAIQQFFERDAEPSYLANIGLHAYRHAIRLHDEASSIRWNKFQDVEELAFYASQCVKAWRNHIYPKLPPHNDQCLVEWQFDIPLFEHRGYQVGIQGTADYVPFGYGDCRDEGPIVDWKTAARKYRQAEKQKSAIQPTIYALAAVESGLRTWPVDFDYGVMIRSRKDEPEGEIVSVQRTEGHGEWAKRLMRQAVDMYLDMGLEKEWPAVGEDSYLCNATWCPWWHLCKGMFVPVEPKAA